MATSNANASVPPVEDAEPHAKGKNYDKAPVIPTMDNGSQEKEISQLRYSYRWRVTFPAPENSEIIPRKKFATLLLMIGQFWPSTVLNTWAEENNPQGLTNGKDLPYLRDDLEVYCPHLKRKNSLETSWNISSDVNLNTMKENHAFMTHLMANQIFINVMKLTTARRDLW
eukprot:9624305-Ditylum_brightwellii.AAC.1